VDAEELRDIEQQVNDEIRLNTEIETNVTSLDEALASGALAFFGDKYPEHNVRVVTIPDPRAARGFYSKELCGGTHVQRVGDIGVLKIVSEESVAAGVRRIEAVTGIGALEHYQQQAQILEKLASQLNVGEDGILAQVEKLSRPPSNWKRNWRRRNARGRSARSTNWRGACNLLKGLRLSPLKWKMLTAKDLGNWWTACGRSWAPVLWLWECRKTGKWPSLPESPRT